MMVSPAKFKPPGQLRSEVIVAEQLEAVREFGMVSIKDQGPTAFRTE